MVAAFKFSCGIIAVAWMFILSFLFGMLQYQDKYAYMAYNDPLTHFVTIVCMYSVVICVLGCCCIKCDVTHIIPIVIYVVASAVVIMALCIYAFTALGGKNGFKMAQADMVIHFREFMKTNPGRIPDYLQHTQLTYHCCGIYGYKDYRAFLLDDSDPGPGGKKGAEDVPASCCKNMSEGMRGFCRAEILSASGETKHVSALVDLYVNKTVGPHKLPIDANLLKDKKREAVIYLKLYGNESNNVTQDTVGESTLSKKPKWLIANASKRLALNREGCHAQLLGNSEALHTGYTILCVCLLVIGALMGVLHVQNCLEVRKKEFEIYHHRKTTADEESQKRRASVRGDLSDKAFHPPGKHRTASYQTMVNAPNGPGAIVAPASAAAAAGNRRISAPVPGASDNLVQQRQTGRHENNGPSVSTNSSSVSGSSNGNDRSRNNSPPDGGISNSKALGIFAGIFLVSVISLIVVYNSFPNFNENEREHVKLPRSIEDAKHLGQVLSQYKDDYYYTVLGGVFITYIFLQTFAIPGSIFLSIMSGFLFSFHVALVLVCFCSATGASFCYLLSLMVGRRLVWTYFPEKAEQWRQVVDRHRDDLLNYIIFLRITPFLPNWFINIASPVVGVPLKEFWLGTFIGVAPPSFVAIRAGTTLHELASSSAALSWTNLTILILLGFLSLIPILIKYKLKDKFQ